MVDKRQCVFTDPKKPVGVRHPLHIEVLKEYLPFFLYFRALLRKIIENYPVVNSLYFSPNAIMIIKKPSSFLYQPGNTYLPDAGVLLREKEIYPGFLFFRKDLQQNNVLGLVTI